MAAPAIPAAAPAESASPLPAATEPSLGWRVRGAWVSGSTAGGSPEHESWVSNDQYHLRLVAPPNGGRVDEGAGTVAAAAVTTVRIVLRQDLPPGASAADAPAISFFVVEALDERRKRRVIDPRGKDPFKILKVSGSRSRAELKARRALARPASGLPYIIVPCTAEPNVAGTYTLEISADKPFVLHGPLPLRSGAANQAEPFTPTAPVKALPLGKSGDADDPAGLVSAVQTPRSARRGNVPAPAPVVARPGAVNPRLSGADAKAAILGADTGGDVGAGAPAPPPAGVALQRALDAHAAAGKPFPYEDVHFPAATSSLYGAGSDMNHSLSSLSGRGGGSPQALGGGVGSGGAQRMPPVQPLRWQRPRAFASAHASLFGAAGEPRPTVVASSHLDDAWLLSAISAVGTARQGDLISKVLSAESYAGAKRGAAEVRLWTGEGWEAVVVDDALPCVNSRLATGAAADPTAVWVSLVEKAFAKRFARSYSALEGVGDAPAALVALTGGVAETLPLWGPDAAADKASGALWARLAARCADGSVLVARTSPPAQANGEHVPRGVVGATGSASGLVPDGHYAVLDAQSVAGERLVCLRNQFDLDEWHGAWSSSDESSWNRAATTLDGGAAGRAGASVATTLAARTAFAVPFAARNGFAAGAQGAEAAGADAEGVFWMSFDDLAANFADVVICRLLDSGNQSPDKWARATARGRWDVETTGGALDSPAWRVNPQFRLAVRRPMRLVLKLSPAGTASPNGGFGAGAGARLGWALLRAMPGRQRKVALVPSDILFDRAVPLDALSAGAAAEVDVLPTDGSFGYVIVAYLATPGAATASPAARQGAGAGGAAGGVTGGVVGGGLDFVLTAYAAWADGGSAGGAAVPGAGDWSMEAIAPGDDWYAVTCVGAWEGATAGGCPNPENVNTWLLNPHFSISAARPTRLQLLLDVATPPAGDGGASAPIAAGALVLSGRAGGGRKRTLTPPDILASTGYKTRASLSAECLLEPSADPYWLVATAFEPGVRGSFRATLYSDAELSVQAVSGGGAVYSGAAVAPGGRRALSTASNQPLPPPSALHAAFPVGSGPATTAPDGRPAPGVSAEPSVTMNELRGQAAGADGGPAPVASAREMAVELGKKAARIYELEQRLKSLDAAGLAADSAADGDGTASRLAGPEPAMLKPPLTADESWPEVIKLGKGLTDAQRKALAASLAAVEAECRASGAKWADPRFPASAVSLPEGFATRVGAGQVDWRRPEEVSADPRLWANDWELAGVVQGAFNDRSFVSAANVAASNPELIHRVFVDTSLGTSCGCYAFRFYGRDAWEVVLIDDRLPCRPDGTLATAVCADHDDFWLPLLEKAYAKFVGGYDRLDRGCTVLEALEDLTGSTGTKVLLDDPQERHRLPGGARPDDLWKQVLTWLHSGYVVGCQFNVKRAHGADRGATPAEVERMGIEGNKAYALLTGGQTMGERLLRVRAATRGREWNGEWADDSPRWTMRMRQMLNYKEDLNDGSFWMGWADFCHHFNKIYAMRTVDDMWTKVVCRGAWQGLTAGGATNFATWRHNPQWIVRPRRPDMKVFLTVAQIDGPTAGPGDGRSAGSTADAHARMAGYANAIGVYIFKGHLARAPRRPPPQAPGASIAEGLAQPSGATGGRRRWRRRNRVAEIAGTPASAPRRALRMPGAKLTRRPLHPPDAFAYVGVARTAMAAGNAPPDDARRKLFLTHEEELVAQAEPQYRRAVTLEATLQPSDTPYVVMPCTFAPGCEGRFSLTIRCDDLDDDGVPDLDVLPVGPPSDWHSITIAHAWAGDAAGGSRDHETWRNNPQFYLIPSARSRMLIFLDVHVDRYAAERGDPVTPPVQLCVARGDGMAKVAQVGPGNLCAESELFADDGLSLELSLGQASRKAPYVVVPCTRDPGSESAFSISVYSEHPFEFNSFDDSGAFPLCATCQSLCPELGTQEKGPLDLLLQRLGEIEGRFDKLEKTRYWEKIPQLRVGGSPMDGPFDAGKRAEMPRARPPAPSDRAQGPAIQRAPPSGGVPPAAAATSTAVVPAPAAASDKKKRPRSRFCVII